MSYDKQTWATGDTITAEGLNHMEFGIYSNSISAIMARRRDGGANGVYYDLYGYEADDQGIVNLVLLTSSNIARYLEGGYVPYIIAERTNDKDPFNAFPVLYVERDTEVGGITTIVCAGYNQWDPQDATPPTFSLYDDRYTWAAKPDDEQG